MQDVYIPKDIMDWLRSSSVIVHDGTTSYMILPFVIKETKIDSRLSRKEVIRMDDVPENIKTEFRKTKI